MPIQLIKRMLILVKQNLSILLFGKTFTVPSLGSMTLDKDDVIIAKEWLKTRNRWQNPKIVQQYEENFAKWNGSKHAFAFMGGRVALSACIAALDLKHGDEVIIPGYTCVVVLNSLHYAGVKVVFSDIELDTFGLDVEQLEHKINENTRAILLHHLYGLVCRDYESILQLAKKRGLRIIEDCAHAAGALFKGVKVGNRGDLAFYSSEQSKIFNTIQGGIVSTNDDELAVRLSKYRDEAPSPDENLIEKQLYNIILNYYQFKHPWRWCFGIFAEIIWGHMRLISTTSSETLGIKPVDYGMKMPAPIAAIGLNQLRKIDTYNELRRAQAKHWDTWCDNNGYTKPFILPESLPVFLRYPVLVEQEKKKSLMWALRREKIIPGVWFLSNAHPAQHKIEGCPNADVAVKRCINFPCLTGF